MTRLRSGLVIASRVHTTISKQAAHRRPPKRKRTKNKKSRNAGPNMKVDSKLASGSTTKLQSMPSTTASIPSSSSFTPAPVGSKRPASRTNLTKSKSKVQKNTRPPTRILSVQVFNKHPHATRGVPPPLNHPVAKTDSHINRFFGQAKYARYRYDPSRPIMEQYHELQRLYGWERGDPGGDEAWEGLLRALVLQFNSTYGEDAESWDSWSGLCHAIGVEPKPTLKACREMIAGIHVNIVDFLEFSRNGQKVQIFTTVEQLSQYTIETGKYFPRNHVLAGGVLQFLLRHIEDPSLNYRYKNRSGPGNRRNTSGPKLRK